MPVNFMNKKVALLTYHAAYNFGSMLQAFATQTAINSLGYDCKIINYRLKSQKDIYATLHWDKVKNPVEYKREIDNLGVLYDYRVKRAKRFESFMKRYMNLTKEINEYKPALEEINKYRVAISGSDQILNMNTGEIGRMTFDYMRPYLLDTDMVKKVSYASSFANTKEEQLDILGPYFNKFSSFSVREKSWQEKVQKYCMCKVEHVADPTFLLTRKDWIRLLNIRKRKPKKKYILFYTLYSYEHTKPKLEILLKTIKYIDVDIHIIAPFCEKSVADISPKIIEKLDCGPREFLDELLNAEFVIPESFHGLTLSIIFNKRFACPSGKTGPELRKIEVLEVTGLSDRWRPNFWEIKLPDIFEDFDYTEANKKIEELRAKSFKYLANSLFE